MATFVIIDTEDFELCCPHCGEVLEEIRIRRIFSPTQECQFCFGEFSVSITAEA